MNRVADRLAERGRREGEVALREPTMFCAPATLRVKGVLEETNIYTVALEHLDRWRLSKAEAMAGASERLENTEQEAVWKEASVEAGRISQRRLFVFQLLYRCLPTPRGIQVANQQYPKLYEDYMCPLCKVAVGDEHHIICTCSALREHRMRAFDLLLKGMRKVVHPSIVDDAMAGIQAAVFPDNKEDFKYGDIPWIFHELVQMQVQRDREGGEVGEGDRTASTGMYAGKVHARVTDMYVFMWEQYREALVNAGMTLADRFKDEYNTTTKAVSTAHRKAVARRRAARIDRETRRANEE